MKTLNTQAIEKYTDNKIANWYKNAKEDYNVIGEGKTIIENNIITVNYKENGVSKVWSMAFYPEYVIENGLDYFYNVWMEEAN